MLKSGNTSVCHWALRGYVPLADAEWDDSSVSLPPCLEGGRSLGGKAPISRSAGPSGASNSVTRVVRVDRYSGITGGWEDAAISPPGDDIPPDGGVAAYPTGACRRAGPAYSQPVPSS